jgi:hypothetical protein
LISSLFVFLFIISLVGAMELTWPIKRHKH